MTKVLGRYLATCAVAAIAASAFAAPTVSGEYGAGGLRLKGSYGHKVVPVPAPIPIPEYDARYYIGLQSGFAFSSSGTISEEGSSVDPRSMDETSELWSAGFSIGKYLTPSIRAELAFDFRPDKGIASAFEEYSENVVLAGPPRSVSGAVFTGDVSSTDVHLYDVERSEKTTYEFQTGLVNFYYDFKNDTRFTPFIGGGVGVVLYTLKRSFSETADCVQTTNVYSDPNIGGTTNEQQFSGATGDPICVREPPSEDVTESETAVSWGLALSATTGLSIDLSEYTKFDIGYRALYTSGSVSSSMPTATGGTSTIKIEDRLDHEIRVGFRWDIE